MNNLTDKHITFIGLNFAPEDTAIGLYSTHMVEALINAGATVNVVTAFPYYPQWKISEPYASKPAFVTESHKGATVYRYKQYVPQTPTFLKRILYILSFTAGTSINLRKIKNVDLVVAIIPFTTSAWLAGKHANKHHARLWIHIQDFEFDAAQQSGLSGGKGLLFKNLFKIEKRILNKAQTASTISHKMMDKLRDKTTTQPYYLPNWIDKDMVNPENATAHPYLSSNKFKLLYSGNVGDKQDWDFFLAFAKALPQNHYDIIIVGAGARYTTLKAQVDLPHVYFYAPVALDRLSDLLCSANAHFLFQKMEVLDTVMPSKLLGMMASGKPSLVLGHPDAEVRHVLETAHAGVYMTAANVSEAVEHVEKWRTQPELLLINGNFARDYTLKTFSREVILSKWIDALSDL